MDSLRLNRQQTGLGHEGKEGEGRARETSGRGASRPRETKAWVLWPLGGARCMVREASMWLLVQVPVSFGTPHDIRQRILATVRPSEET